MVELGADFSIMAEPLDLRIMKVGSLIFAPMRLLRLYSELIPGVFAARISPPSVFIKPVDGSTPAGLTLVSGLKQMGPIFDVTPQGDLIYSTSAS